MPARCRHRTRHCKSLLADALNAACRHLRDGGIIAYPTEAVWGLGCDPFNGDAVRRILRLKGREESKGLILVAAGMEQVQPLLKGLSPEMLARLESTWPGPVTWLIPDPQGYYPGWIKGEHASVAVRVSAHPPVRDLCEAFGAALVSTSANRAGEPPIRCHEQLQAEFGGSDDSDDEAIDYILPGSLGEQQQPSQIRDLITGNTLRE